MEIESLKESSIIEISTSIASFPAIGYDDCRKVNTFNFRETFFLHAFVKANMIGGNLLDRIILFDGDCNFCDKSVQFIINRDPKGYYKLASLQSNAGKKIKQKMNIPEDLDSMIYIHNNRYYDRSSAILRICKNLKGVVKWGYILLIIPKPIRDFFYKIIAKNRYKWFGKKTSCMIPTPEMKKRFL